MARLSWCCPGDLCSNTSRRWRGWRNCWTPLSAAYSPTPREGPWRRSWSPGSSYSPSLEKFRKSIYIWPALLDGVGSPEEEEAGDLHDGHHQSPGAAGGGLLAPSNVLRSLSTPHRGVSSAPVPSEKWDCQKKAECSVCQISFLRRKVLPRIRRLCRPGAGSRRRTRRRSCRWRRWSWDQCRTTWTPPPRPRCRGPRPSRASARSCTDRTLCPDVWWVCGNWKSWT